MPNFVFLRILGISILVGSPSVAEPTDEKQAWPQFRGPRAAGVVCDKHPVITEFGRGKQMVWKCDLPSGHSSPCVWGEHLFLTTFTADESKLELWKISRDTGEMIWRVAIPTEQIEKAHPDFNPASSTPMTDGECVVAYFGSGGLFCFDNDGNQRWSVPMPLASSYSGTASSPVIVDDKVVFYRATYEEHYLLAVELESGKELWRYRFFWPFRANHSCAATPMIWNDQVILHYSNGISSHAVRDGQPVWWVNAATTATSTHVMGDDELFVATWTQTGEPDLIPEYPDFDTALKQYDQDGSQTLSRREMPRLAFFHRPEGKEAAQSFGPAGLRSLDRNGSKEIERDEWEQFRTSLAKRRDGIRQHGLLGIKLDGKGNVTNSHVRLLESQAIPEVPSPIFHDGRVYMVKNGGILTCVDVRSGKRLYRTRIGTRGTHYASPVLWNGKLLVASGEGELVVVEVGGEKPEVLAKNDFGERIYATPAIVDGVLYVRTEKALYAFRAS